MWPTEEELESLSDIITRMNPNTCGKPYQMICDQSKEYIPKKCGNPIISAYTKNGYWYKFVWSDFESNFWKDIIEEVHKREHPKFILPETFKSHYRLLIAKNISDEPLGAAILNENHLSFIYIVEDFRHVGIGSNMMKFLAPDSFNAASYLLKSVGYFDLKVCVGREMYLTSMFLKKQCDINMVQHNIKLIKNPTNDIIFSQFYRDMIKKNGAENILVAVKDNKNCVGIAITKCVTESGVHEKSILISPLVAEDEEIASSLCAQILCEFQNSRKFYVFLPNNEKATFFRKMGLEIDISYIYQTCSKHPLPAVRDNVIYSTSFFP